MPRQRLHVLPHLLQRLGTHPPARVGDDAVGAKPVAAVLNFQERPRAVVEFAHRHRFKRVAGFVRLDVHNALVRGEVGQDMRQQAGAVAVAQHHVGFAQPLRLLRERLRHTARQDDNRIGMGAPRTVQGLAHLLVAGGGDGAGIEQHHVRRLALGTGLEPAFQQLPKYCLGFVLIDLTAQRNDRNFHKGISLSACVCPGDHSERDAGQE